MASITMMKCTILVRLYRLFQGDAYLVQDWKIHIMSCIPLYPFYILFRLAVGSNEGIILYLRILYTIFQLAVALVCFLRLKRFGWASFFVGLIYLLFTPLILLPCPTIRWDSVLPC